MNLPFLTAVLTGQVLPIFRILINHVHLSASVNIPGTLHDYLHYLNAVKSRQISNILKGFLSKCQNRFDFSTDHSKSQKNDKNIELELFASRDNKAVIGAHAETSLVSFIGCQNLYWLFCCSNL